MGQQYNVIHSGIRQNQPNLNHQQSVIKTEQIYPSKQVQIQPSARSTRNQYNQQMMAPPLQPSVQINIQSLIKPMQQPDKPQNPPIVYSFGQSDFSNKFFSNNNQSKANTNKKISWGLDDTIDYKEDDFADILG